MNSKSTRSQAATSNGSAEALDSAVELVAAAVRGEPADARWLGKRSSSDAFLEVVEAHGVGPLLHHSLKSGPGGENWPDDIRDTLAEKARQEAVREAIRVEETRRVLAALKSERVAPLVLKGAALAYSLYPRPHLRPREDTDLLVRQAAVADVVRTLRALGYRRHERLPGQRVLRQDTYLRKDETGYTHALDLHWAISNRPALANSLDYAEIRQRAVAIEALSPCAMGLCHEDALLHACLHRLAHGDEDNLIWLYDIHLLVESLSATEFERFAQTALAKRLGRASRDAIAKAQLRFRTTLPCGELDDHFYPERLADEARLVIGLSPGRRFRNLLVDIRALGSVRERMSWLREHALPPPAYMRERYGAGSAAWLPALYIRRGLKGVASLLKRSH
ncbi:MAG TPA: nucleotidyltransferase family protein [Gammaproteobacteria bacterium]|nr:nucleotidyltransferase family protein [Gammaproteobacteria bacterium]